MKTFQKRFFAAIMCISMLLLMSFSAFASEPEDTEELQPGWVKVNDYYFENPTTGEYFEIIPKTNRDSKESVTFNFLIKYSFKCPTKFTASGETASVESSADRVTHSEITDNSVELNYAIEIGTKKVDFYTGNSSTTETVSGLKANKSYTVTASTQENTQGYYVKGWATVE